MLQECPCPVALGARKQRAVLAMLALHVDHTLSVDRLAEGLWGEELPPSAAKMVQLYVSRLRRLLEGDGAQIVTRGRGSELRLAQGQADAIPFESLLESAHPREGLALWRIEPLSSEAVGASAKKEAARRGSGHDSEAIAADTHGSPWTRLPTSTSAFSRAA